MRSALFLALVLSCAGLCQAQTPSAAESNPSSPAPLRRAGVEVKVEHLRLEDAGARVDELRVGGESKSITVQPKGGMPAYQVQPVSGERSWKILGF